MSCSQWPLATLLLTAAPQCWERALSLADAKLSWGGILPSLGFYRAGKCKVVRIKTIRKQVTFACLTWGGNENKRLIIWTLFLSLCNPLTDLCPGHLPFPEVGVSAAEPRAHAARERAGAHSEAGAWPPSPVCSFVMSLGSTMCQCGANSEVLWLFDSF